MWTQLTEENPQHSAAYIQRFKNLAADGFDLVGEARLVDAMLPRGSRVLDAGSGTGRIAAHLAAVGHTVVGVDGDPELVAAAQADSPGPEYLVADLAELDLPAQGIGEPFDLIVCAGNVMTFLAASTRREVLRRLLAHLAGGGRAAIGFGAGRGYEFDDFLEDAAATGWEPDLLLSTWDLRPFTRDSDFLVAILRRTESGRTLS
jgi:SAM-dependent methyltransferase